MRGVGTKLQITKNSTVTAHLLDLTRTAHRAGRHPTGIDRIERAYLQHMLEHPTPLFGFVRTKVGFLLLDAAGCAALLKHIERPIWSKPDLISSLSRRKDPTLAATETGLRRLAIARSTPIGLTRMLKHHLPSGTVYFNVGQTNFTDRVVHALKACDDLRVVVYIHDTIPLDLPQTQTVASRTKFKRYFGHCLRSAHLILCNSQHTKEQIELHAADSVPPPIHVLLPGAPDITTGAAPQGPWTGKPYFMAIGTIEPRKNIAALLDIWEAYTSPFDPVLLICGRRGWMSGDVFERLDSNPLNVHELNRSAR